MVDGSHCYKCNKEFQKGEMRCGICQECLDCHPQSRFDDHERLLEAIVKVRKINLD